MSNYPHGGKQTCGWALSMKARLLAKAYSPMAITELRPFVCLLFLTDELSLTAEAEEVPSNNGVKNLLKSPLSKYLQHTF